MADSTTLPKPIRKRRIIFWFAVIIASVLSAVWVQQHRHTHPGASAAALTPNVSERAVKAKPGLPVRLKIPKIGSDLSIESVGINAEGDLDVPKNPAGAGWYQDGARPGEAASAVIDGHYGWVEGHPAVFNNLHVLEKGDEISIDDDAGITRTFAVTGSRVYAPNEKATAIFYTDDGVERLNIITCEGVWDASQGGYTGRLVVFAVKK